MSSSRKGTDGFLVVVSSPSGGGKTTVVDRLLKRHPDWLRSVSVTTRPARENEKEGHDYFFVTPERFEQMRRNDELLESAEVFKNSYGTPRRFVEDAIDSGKIVILAIDVQGARSIRQVMKNRRRRMTVFIIPPSIKVLRERLENRKSDTPEQIELRLETAQEEIRAATEYDFTVMNKTLEQTVFDIEEVIRKFDTEREAH